MVTFAPIARFKTQITLAGLALALVTAMVTPLAGTGNVVAKKHHNRQHSVSKQAKKILTDVAIDDIELAPHADSGHRTVVVAVSNDGIRPVSGFNIGMVAKNPNQPNGGVRNEVFSAELNLGKGESTKVEFRLGCNWINNGTINARTDPAPVAKELPHYADNNTLEESFGGGGV
jgi:hypothetical protein